MSGQIHNPFHGIALDRDLIQSEFKFQTNWHVITGASCSGKTTLINQLAERGYRTVPEAGRQYVEQELAKGYMLEQIRADLAVFTRRIYTMMLNQERNLPVGEVAFLDRALPDSFSFFRYAGIDPNDILADCLYFRYASVFILDRLPYKRDGVRAGGDPTAKYFDAWIERDYLAFGYDVVRVPVLQPAERLAFVLDLFTNNSDALENQ
jgi:predicted ATPase